MKRVLPTLIAAAAVLALAFVAVRRPAPAPARTDPPVVVQSAGAGETVAISRAREEIFRRAFWRQPAAADRIVLADRREWSDQHEDVQRWQWFLQVEPGPELLKTLRDPATFGLLPTRNPRPLPRQVVVPAWFPTAAQVAGCEILQASGGGLTVYYRAADNVLFATDAGRGFTPPVTRVATR
ncbi:MAG: hypothetical protein JSS11_11080 [Verrucomicrobia bacterium]|nr:hypothetical protein [Verrucomicrobiota bacterium]